MKKLTGDQYMTELRRRSIQEEDLTIQADVAKIIKKVRLQGDEALFAYTRQFDQLALTNLAVLDDEITEAKKLVGQSFIHSIKKAYDNIFAFHERQLEKTWFIDGQDGIMLGQKVTPLQSVGIYVPGGKAAYPSTVLMNAVPAKIAGVPRIVMVTPAQANGKVNPYVLTAATIAGVNTIYKVGGAQAIAALAYGTETVKKVVKIVGPGNAYVAEAKKQVFGDVAIDMIAGPSEVCIVADDKANPAYVAADLISQAEHDEQASAICITTSEPFIRLLEKEISRQIARADRREIIEKSINKKGRIVFAASLEEAFHLVNELAPEHLQLMIHNPSAYLEEIHHAGAIFLGAYSPEALGDYFAGPNHTLPTNGTAKYSSPLGVYDFLKKTSVIQYAKEPFLKVADDIIRIAKAEGLTAHAYSIEIRKELEG